MGLSFAEIAIILIVALVVIGPDKLPDVAKSVGKGYAEFKRAFSDLKKTVDITSDISINDKKGNGGTAKTYRDTYRSRWEESQASEPVQDVQPENTTQEQVAEAVKPERARKSDLVKGEEDVNNG